VEKFAGKEIGLQDNTLPKFNNVEHFEEVTPIDIKLRLIGIAIVEIIFSLVPRNLKINVTGRI